MRAFRDFPIRIKLIVIILISSIGSVLFISALFWSVEYSRARDEMASRIDSVAQVVSVNIVVPFIVKERRLVHDTLQSLQADPEISLAMIFDAKGRPFARYLRDNTLASASELQNLLESDPNRFVLTSSTKNKYQAFQSYFTNYGFSYIRQIAHDETVATLYIEADTRRLAENMKTFLSQFAIVLGILLFFVYLFAHRVQQRVHAYVTDLMALVETIQEEDFSPRLTKKTGDEVGVVVEGINSLLDHIEQRDEMLHQYSETLEEKIDIRTRELELKNKTLWTTFEKLNFARKKAEDADSAKGRFLAVVSHEIKQPMTGVVLALELLQETALSQQQEELTDIVLSSANSITDAFDQLLDYAKLEGTSDEICLAETDIEQIIEDVVTNFYYQAKKKQLNILLDIPISHRHAVLTDGLKFRQIISNLVSNAIKFTSVGSIVVELKVVGSTPSSRHYQCIVHDSGPGVPLDDIDIFLPFTQKGSQETKVKGTGLGLSIATECAKALGGTLSYENRSDGADFIFDVTFRVEDRENQKEINFGGDVTVYSSDSKFLSIARDRLCEVGASVETGFDRECLVPKDKRDFLIYDCGAEIDSGNELRKGELHPDVQNMFASIVYFTADSRMINVSSLADRVVMMPVSWRNLLGSLFDPIAREDCSAEPTEGKGSDNIQVLYIHSVEQSETLVKVLLEKAGFVFRPASPDKIDTVTTQFIPDVIVVDLVDLDEENVMVISNHYSWTECPVVVLSDHKPASDFPLGFLAEAPVLKRPFNGSMLVEHVTSAMGIEG